MVAARSYLYAPGDRPDRLRKAWERAGDAVIADLEDAVAPQSKQAALDAVLAWLDTDLDGGPEVWVRVNAGDRGLHEIEAVRRARHVRGIVLPKADAASVAAAVAQADELLVAPLIESARGLLDAPTLAGMPRVSHLGIGESDLRAELGLPPDPEGAVLTPLRLQVVVASAAAQLAPPTGPVHLDVRDHDALRVSTERLRALGFGARSAIHPEQVPVIETVFTPTAEEIEAATAVVESYDRSLAEGTGVVLDAQGRMVDEAVVRSSRRVLQLTERVRRR